MARVPRFSLSATLSMLEVPMPEDDDMSEDEFEGYLEDDDLTAGGDNSHDSSDDVHELSSTGWWCWMYPHPRVWTTSWLCWGHDRGISSSILPTDGNRRDAREDCRADQPLCTTIHGKHQSPPTFQSTWLEQSNVRHGWVEEIPRHDHHYGSRQLPRVRRLLVNKLALCHISIFQGVCVSVTLLSLLHTIISW